MHFHFKSALSGWSSSYQNQAHATACSVALGILSTFTLQARGNTGRAVPYEESSTKYWDVEKERQTDTQVLNCSKQADNKLASMEDFIMPKEF